MSSKAQLDIGQEEFPFQVLYAENAAVSGQPLKQLQTVSQNATINLTGGFLALIHESGFAFEFSGDTVVSVSPLHDQFEKIRSKLPSSLRAPHLPYLFVDEPGLAENTRLKFTRVCHDCGTDLFYPPLMYARIFYRDDLCVRWEGKPARYNVELRSVFNDLLRTYSVDSNYVFIPASDLAPLRKQEEQMVLIISPADKYASSISPKIIEWNPYTTYSCEIQYATAAVMAGFLEETAGSGHSIARIFFERAVAISDRPFFRQMLDNFNRRHPE